MRALTKEQFFAAEDLPLTAVPLPPELYGEDVGVYVRTMDGEERSAMERRFQTEKSREDPTKFREVVLLATTVDGDGEPLFSQEDASDLLKKNSGTLEMIFDKSCEVNGFTKSDVEKLEKNSESGP